MTDFGALLRSYGLRATEGRIELLQLLQKAGKPLSVNEVLVLMKGDLNQVTLYRALEGLAEVGLVRKGMHERTMRFEYAGNPHHHHLVCSDCGFIRECQTC